MSTPTDLGLMQRLRAKSLVRGCIPESLCIGSLPAWGRISKKSWGNSLIFTLWSGGVCQNLAIGPQQPQQLPRPRASANWENPNNHNARPRSLPITTSQCLDWLGSRKRSGSNVSCNLDWLVKESVWGRWLAGTSGSWPIPKGAGWLSVGFPAVLRHHGSAGGGLLFTPRGPWLSV